MHPVLSRYFSQEQALHSATRNTNWISACSFIIIFYAPIILTYSSASIFPNTSHFLWNHITYTLYLFICLIKDNISIKRAVNLLCCNRLYKCKFRATFGWCKLCNCNPTLLFLVFDFESKKYIYSVETLLCFSR